MNPRKRRGRIEIIDIAKCIAIFMVVLGHTASNAELLGDPPVLYKVLYPRTGWHLQQGYYRRERTRERIGIKGITNGGKTDEYNE